MSFGAEPLYFDELEVGQEWVSGGRTVTEADIAAFADLTGDRSPIHLDPNFARATPFRRCIAHELLGLSMGGGLSLGAPRVRTAAFLGLREWHFRAPVYLGDTIRVRTSVLEKELQGRGRRGKVVWRVQFLNQSDRIVQEGITLTLVETASGVSPTAAAGRSGERGGLLDEP
jgi:3-hydroxybutyryl-CoA dehydratase